MKRLFPNYPLGETEQKPTKPKKNGINNTKIKQLGLEFTPLETSIKDMVHRLAEIGVIPKL